MRTAKRRDEAHTQGRLQALSVGRDRVHLRARFGGNGPRRTVLDRQLNALPLTTFDQPANDVLEFIAHDLHAIRPLVRRQWVKVVRTSHWSARNAEATPAQRRGTE